MRVGIVGAGFMGATHAAAWAATPATIAGIVAASEEEATPLASSAGLRIYPDVAALVADVDVVDICTPTYLHHEMVLQAAAAGKNIICEKPLGLSIEQGQEMIAACKQAGVRLLVAHVVRYFAEYALARELVQAGRVGKTGVIRLRRGGSFPERRPDNWFLDPAKSGGMIVDLMIHDLDYARWIAGEVESVYARSLGNEQPGTINDYALVILKHQNGTLSHLTGAWAYPPPTFRTGLEIAGDGGLIEFSTDEARSIAPLLQPAVGLPASPLLEGPYTSEIKEFYAALSEDKPVRVTAEDGLAALQLALAAAESARTGEVVQIAPLAEVQR